MLHLIPSITAFAGTLLIIFYCYRFAVSIKLVDKPGHRKKHKGEIPLIGGIAIIFGFSLACLISPRSLSEWRPLFLCMIPLATVGIMDDHGDVSVKKRIIAQIISCLVMIYHGGVRIDNFGDLFGIGAPVSVNGLETVLTVFCVLGVINALNLIDGIDGLCATLCLVTMGGILALVRLMDLSTSLALLLYFGSALFAFLIVNLELANRHIKKVFLGDTGTTIIGFFLCWNLIRMTNGSDAVFRPITAVWLIALPIMDTLTVMIRRIRLKRSPFRAGRDHIHHILMDVGFSPMKTLMILVALSFGMAAVGVFAEAKDVPEYFMFYAMLILFGLYFAISDRLQRIYSTVN